VRDSTRSSSVNTSFCLVAAVYPTPGTTTAVSHATAMRFLLLTGIKNRPKIGVNSLWKWIYFDRLMGNAEYCVRPPWPLELTAALYNLPAYSTVLAGADSETDA
jgi:hypothetical protein